MNSRNVKRKNKDDNNNNDDDDYDNINNNDDDEDDDDDKIGYRRYCASGGGKNGYVCRDCIDGNMDDNENDFASDSSDCNKEEQQGKKP